MLKLHDGQCGLCGHFGEHQPSNGDLVQIRVKGEAPENFVQDCGEPELSLMHLQVTATSGCDRFVQARKAG